MLIIPVQPLPAQTFSVALNGQNCGLTIYQKSTGLFIDVYLANTLLLAGTICLDRNVIIRDAYWGFQGDLSFVDQQGTSDPTYAGLGSRFLLYYLQPADLVAFGVS